MQFNSEFFVGNRQRLQQLFTGSAPIVITANGLIQKSADETYTFEQDSNFWYLTGIDEPNLLLVMDKGKEYLIVPELSHAKEMFDGALVPEKLSQTSGIAEVITEKEGWKRLGSRLKRCTSVAVLAPPPAYVDHLGMYTNPAKRRLLKQIKQLNSEIKPLDLRNHLQRMRMVKQPVELEAITEAIHITNSSIKTILKKFSAGKFDNEKQIELELTNHFINKGASGHGFDPIIAGGAKAAQIHSVTNNSAITNNTPLLLDVGAKFNNYSADITRCYIKEPSKRYRAVYAAVQEVFDYAVNLLKPGVVVLDYEEKVEHYMGEKLRALGLIKTINSENVRHYFPHRTSHFLGIDVHDYGDYDHPLSKGVVLTVEPGIYIPEENIGVRIEDDILITSTGNRNLSAKLPRSL